MTLRLSDLQDCLEGVIPSIIATSSADGMPNVSYLSHVEMVDDEHVALSNQFFGKTDRNLRDNPQACIIVVDAVSGRQVRLAATWLRNETEGPLFDAMTASLRASSAQVGMAEVMRLESVAIFRVETITALPHPEGLEAPPVPHVRARLAGAPEVVAAVAAETETSSIVDALLNGVRAMLDAPGAILFQHDAARNTLLTLASRGYPRSGAGSEIEWGAGIAGAAAALGRPVRASDMSRIRRFGAAIRDTSPAEEESRIIPLPGLPDAQSQIAVPMIAKGALYGVLFAESPARLAFRHDDGVALAMVANHAAATLLIGEELARSRPPRRSPRRAEAPPGAFASCITASTTASSSTTAT